MGDAWPFCAVVEPGEDTRTLSTNSRCHLRGRRFIEPSHRVLRRIPQFPPWGAQRPVGVKNGSVRACAARPFYPQEQISSASRHVRLVPKTEVPGLARHVRFTLRSRYLQPAPACPFGAMNRLKRRSKQRLYSITSSARASSMGEMVRPSALAVLRFSTSSNLVGCWMGRSAGFAPFRMAST